MQTLIAPIPTAPLSVHVKTDILVMAISVMMSMNVKFGVSHDIKASSTNPKTNPFLVHIVCYSL